MSPVDDELLSLYLDNALSVNERATLEQRLAAEPSLRAELDDLRRAIAILKAAPQLAPPRDFTLDPARYSRRAARRPAAVLRLSAVLTALLVVAGALLLINRNSSLPGSTAAGSSAVALLATNIHVVNPAVLATNVLPTAISSRSVAPEIQQATSTRLINAMNAGLTPTATPFSKAAAPTLLMLMTATAPPATYPPAPVAATSVGLAAPSAADGASNSSEAPGSSDRAVPKDTDVLMIILRWLLTLLRGFSR